MASSRRTGGRSRDELRTVEIVTNYTKWAEGAVLCSFGDTRVLCTASVEDRLPQWARDQGRGWVTAEYAMLPRATDKRSQRESVSGKVGGRTHEISRLIGRALRGSVDLKRLGERTLTVDCDVIQADGGTRTTAITGAWVAIRLATDKLLRAGKLDQSPVTGQLAAVSLGKVDGEIRVDLDYGEDQRADTDLNLVMTADGGIVEIQGTAERAALTRGELEEMLDLGRSAIGSLFGHQLAALGSARR